MKKYILIVLASLFSASSSTDDLDHESNSESKGFAFQIDNLGIVTFTPKKAYDNTSRGKCMGVFGNQILLT